MNEGLDFCLIINLPDYSVPSPVSSLVNKYSKYLDKAIQFWQDTEPVYQYGNCFQTVSLLLYNRKTKDTASLSTKIISEGDSTHFPCMNPGWIECCSLQILNNRVRLILFYSNPRLLCSNF